MKPWGIDNYAVVYDAAATPKPLAFRQRATGATGLNTVATIALYPWEAEYMEAEFGFGVWNRGAAAVHYFGGGTYTDPTITG